MVTRFTAAELSSYRGAVVDDLVSASVRLLFVGINPSLWTAAVNAHFARPGNRFWPALHLAGITPWLVDASGGLSDEDTRMLSDRGIGITNVVPVATARADELTIVQLRDGAARLVDMIDRLQPPVVAVLGITAYRAAFDRPKAVAGRQAERLADDRAELWVLPNPSGLNAHETVITLADAYRRAAGGMVNPRPAAP